MVGSIYGGALSLGHRQNGEQPVRRDGRRVDHSDLPAERGLPAITSRTPSTIGELWMIGYLLWRGTAGHLSLVPRTAALSARAAG